MKRQTDPDVILLQAAADPSRLAILRQLAAGDGVCACDFTTCCDVTQPTVSRHLKVLREAGWVRSERQANFIYYYLRPEAPRPLPRVGKRVDSSFRFASGTNTPGHPAVRLIHGCFFNRAA